MEKLGVAVESEGRIVEVAIVNNALHFSRIATFMLNRWSGAKELKTYKCKIIIEEQVGAG